MAAHVSDGAGLVFTVAMLVDGHKTALFTQLITYLALVSIAVWAVVIASTLLRIVARRMYRLRMHIQRRLPTD